MLELNKVCVSFRSERQDKIFGHTRQQVLFDVSLRVEKGTCLGILGESGSGKSTMGRVLCGLLKPDSGDVQLDGVSVYASRSGRRNLQNKLSVVFQDYTTSANPRFRVKEIIGEGLTVRERREGNKLDRDRETASLLELVGLPTDFATRFPHELSGGQLQRVCIARAVACKPEIILFDEAISSLDAHTQVQVMDLLRELKEKLGLLSLAFSGPAIVLHGILIGLGDTRSVLIANVIGNGVNVALNVLLIHGIGPFPALGVLGAGISTAIGTGVTLIFTLAIFLRKDHSASLRGYGTWLPQKNYLKMIAPLAFGVFCEQAAERFGMFTFARLVANLRTSALGVHNICSGLCDIFYSFSQGLGKASLVLSGQAYGGDQMSRLQRIADISRQSALWTGAAATLLYFLFRIPLLQFYHLAGNDLLLGGQIMLFVAAINIPEAWAMIHAGMLRGIGRTGFVAVYSLISIAVIRPILTYILIYPLNMGLHGAWIALSLDQITRAVCSHYGICKTCQRENTVV